MWNPEEEFPELAAAATADPNSSSARLLRMLRIAEEAINMDHTEKSEVNSKTVKLKSM